MDESPAPPEYENPFWLFQFFLLEPGILWLGLANLHLYRGGQPREPFLGSLLPNRRHGRYLEGPRRVPKLSPVEKVLPFDIDRFMIYGLRKTTLITFVNQRADQKPDNQEPPRR